MVLLSHFHSLSSFVFSCGLTQKLDGLSSPKLKTPPSIQKTVLGDITITNNNNVMDHNNQLLAVNGGGGGIGGQMTYNNNSSGHAAEGGVVGGAGGLLNGTGSNGIAKPQQQLLPGPQGVSVEALMERMKVLSQKQAECSEAELSNRFKSVEMQTAELPAATLEAVVEVPPIISHYIDDPTFTYQDFARRGAEAIPNTFRIQDYSWDDHGYSLVNG